MDTSDFTVDNILHQISHELRYFQLRQQSHRGKGRGKREREREREREEGVVRRKRQRYRTER